MMDSWVWRARRNSTAWKPGRYPADSCSKLHHRHIHRGYSGSNLSTHRITNHKTEGHTIIGFYTPPHSSQKNMEHFRETVQPWQRLRSPTASYFTCSTQQGSLSKRRSRADVDPLLAVGSAFGGTRRNGLYNLMEGCYWGEKKSSNSCNEIIWLLDDLEVPFYVFFFFFSGR